MIPVDGTVMREIAPRFSGKMAERQAEIIKEAGQVLQATLEAYEINTRLRIAHFLGQTCHEPPAFAPRRNLPAVLPMRAARISATSRRVMAASTRGAACCSLPAAPTMPNTAKPSGSISRTIRPWPLSLRCR